MHNSSNLNQRRITEVTKPIQRTIGMHLRSNSSAMDVRSRPQSAVRLNQRSKSLGKLKAGQSAKDQAGKSNDGGLS